MKVTPKKFWHVYLLRCADGSLYAGVTNDLPARLAAHNDGRGSKYVRSRLPAVLAWSRRCASETAAKKLEREIKTLSRTTKLELVASQSLSNIKKNFRQS